MTGDQQSMVAELLAMDHGLRDREIQFIEDLNDKYEERGLSEAQTDWLESIYYRVFP